MSRIFVNYNRRYKHDQICVLIDVERFAWNTSGEWYDIFDNKDNRIAIIRDHIHGPDKYGDYYVDV